MINNMNGAKTIRGNVIGAYSDGFIIQNKSRISYIDASCRSRRFLFSVKQSGLRGAISKFGRPGERLSRNEIRAGAEFDGKFYFSFNGVCYGYDFDNSALKGEHFHRAGMRSPLMFAVIKDVAGFDDQICYGEYFTNENRESVSVWSKRADGEWTAVTTFDAGKIRHIHGIFPDRYRGCVYILTGDKDEECAIWAARDNFRSVEKLISGDQQARACRMLVYERGFMYCTDSESEQNALYNVPLDGKEIKKEKIGEFDASVIYGASAEDVLLVSTTVEPDAGGIRSNFVQVFLIGKNGAKTELMRAKKDALPMKLFQYGYARITVNGDCFALSFTGVKRLDGKTVVSRLNK